MTKRVTFWRTVREEDETAHPIALMGIDEPDELSDDAAIERAAAVFCASTKVFDWHDAADRVEVTQRPTN